MLSSHFRSSLNQKWTDLPVILPWLQTLKSTTEATNWGQRSAIQAYLMLDSFGLPFQNYANFCFQDIISKFELISVSPGSRLLRTELIFSSDIQKKITGTIGWFNSFAGSVNNRTLSISAMQPASELDFRMTGTFKKSQRYYGPQYICRSKVQIHLWLCVKQKKFDLTI